LAVDIGQRQEGSVGGGFRSFSSAEDNWLEFLKRRHPVECQKYIWLKLQQLQSTVGLSWVLQRLGNET